MPIYMSILNMNKICDIANIAEILRLRRGKTVVHCHGCWDAPHFGHVLHFQSARKMGNILIVTVTPDKYVNKGPNRPLLKQQVRAEAIAVLECVDYVAVNRWPTAVPAIELIKPDFYVKGPDYNGNVTVALAKEKQAVERVGGKLVFTDDVKFSSTVLINGLR